MSLSALALALSSGGAHVASHETLGSTNTEAMRLATLGAAHGTIVVADHQSAGRGRAGRTWFADAGSHILMSVIWRLDWPAAQAPQVTLHVAAAVARAIERACGIRVGLKWPNDALIDNKKCVGILTELQTSGDRVDAVVIGIGVDVAPLTGAPDELRAIATSLSEAAGSTVDRTVVGAALARELAASYDHLVTNGCWDRAGWLAYECTLGRRVQVDGSDGPWFGQAVDIAGNGALMVEHSDGRPRVVTSGDVLLREGEGA